MQIKQYNNLSLPNIENPWKGKMPKDKIKLNYCTYKYSLQNYFIIYSKSSKKR